MILRRRADIALDREPGEEGGDLLGSHVRRVPLPVKEDEASDPADVSLLRSAAVVPGPDRVPNLVEKLGLLSLLGTGLAHGEEHERSSQGWSRITGEPGGMLEGGHHGRACAGAASTSREQFSILGRKLTNGGVTAYLARNTLNRAAARVNQKKRPLF